MTSQLLKYYTNRHFLLSLRFCGVIIYHTIGNKIRVDATLIFDHEALLQGHQGQMILSSLFMFVIFELSNKVNIDS